MSTGIGNIGVDIIGILVLVLMLSAVIQLELTRRTGSQFVMCHSFCGLRVRGLLVSSARITVARHTANVSQCGVDIGVSATLMTY